MKITLGWTHVLNLWLMRIVIFFSVYCSRCRLPIPVTVMRMVHGRCHHLHCLRIAVCHRQEVNSLRPHPIKWIPYREKLKSSWIQCRKFYSYSSVCLFSCIRRTRFMKRRKTQLFPKNWRVERRSTHRRWWCSEWEGNKIYEIASTRSSAVWFKYDVTFAVCW